MKSRSILIVATMALGLEVFDRCDPARAVVIPPGLLVQEHMSGPAWTADR